jgi:ABC-type nickel/cobalt efflux system permease component RcnA
MPISKPWSCTLAALVVGGCAVWYTWSTKTREIDSCKRHSDNHVAKWKSEHDLEKQRRLQAEMEAHARKLHSHKNRRVQEVKQLEMSILSDVKDAMKEYLNQEYVDYEQRPL